MRRFIKHYKLWYEWQEGCLNTWYYKLGVLLGLWVSPTFEQYKALTEFWEGENSDEK